MRRPRILYAGDSEAGGPANYLLAILKARSFEVRHIPPSENLRPSLVRETYDAFLLSDFPKRRTPRAAEERIVEQVRRGAGLLMAGGWASFSGPFGGWRGSQIEALLPVCCKRGDDRVVFPGGAYPVLKEKHPALNGLSFQSPPVICGLNALRPKGGSLVLLTVRALMPRAGKVNLAKKEYPLLILSSDPMRRTAAFASDFAPHWCGGLLDWGGASRAFPVSAGIRVEVGLSYFRLVSALLAWLTGLR